MNLRIFTIFCLNNKSYKKINKGDYSNKGDGEEGKEEKAGEEAAVFQVSQILQLSIPWFTIVSFE